MKKVIAIILVLVMTAALTAVAAAASGDVNADGSINNKDVVALFRYASGNEDAVKDKTACDYNGDGGLTPEDARLILRRTVGLRD